MSLVCLADCMFVSTLCTLLCFCWQINDDDDDDDEIMSQKTRFLRAVHGKDFVIIACTVLIGLKSATNGQTDRCPGHG